MVVPAQRSGGAAGHDLRPDRTRQCCHGVRQSVARTEPCEVTEMPQRARFSPAVDQCCFRRIDTNDKDASGHGDFVSDLSRAIAACQARPQPVRSCVSGNPPTGVKRDDRQRWVSESRGWEHRCTCDIQVVGSVNATISVNDSTARIRVHSRRAGVVVSVRIRGDASPNVHASQLRGAEPPRPHPCAIARARPVPRRATASAARLAGHRGSRGRCRARSGCRRVAAVPSSRAAETRPTAVTGVRFVPSHIPRLPRVRPGYAGGRSRSRRDAQPDVGRRHAAAAPAARPRPEAPAAASHPAAK